MKLRILYIALAIGFIMYPILHALIFGYDYQVLFRDIAVCAVGAAFSLTIVHLLHRIERLEEKNNKPE